jgi:large subunit ribosomal protein L19
VRENRACPKTSDQRKAIPHKKKWSFTSCHDDLEQARYPTTLAQFPVPFVMSIITTIEKEQFKTDLVPFEVGDSICVHTRVIEGDKERIQKYSGIVIGRKGTGINANFTVRRVSFGEGVERVFPLHSPRIAKVEVEKRGSIRRSKLNYLRDRKGKAAVTVKEKASDQASK